MEVSGGSGVSGSPLMSAPTSDSPQNHGGAEEEGPGSEGPSLRACSSTFQMVQGNADTFWRFQRYHLIVEYQERPALAPPFILLSHLGLALQRAFRKEAGQKRARLGEAAWRAGRREGHCVRPMGGEGVGGLGRGTPVRAPAELPGSCLPGTLRGPPAASRERPAGAPGPEDGDVGGGAEGELPEQAGAEPAGQRGRGAAEDRPQVRAAGRAVPGPPGAVASALAGAGR